MRCESLSIRSPDEIDYDGFFDHCLGPDVNLARNELEGVLITHDLSKGSSLTIVC